MSISTASSTASFTERTLPKQTTCSRTAFKTRGTPFCSAGETSHLKNHIRSAELFLTTALRFFLLLQSRLEKLNSSETRSRRPRATSRRNSSWSGKRGFPSPTSIKVLLHSSRDISTRNTRRPAALEPECSAIGRGTPMKQYPKDSTEH